jgi:hypothetical protein
MTKHNRGYNISIWLNIGYNISIWIIYVGVGFEPRSSHLSTLKMKFLSLNYLTKKYIDLDKLKSRGQYKYLFIYIYIKETIQVFVTFKMCTTTSPHQQIKCTAMSY